MMRLVHLELSEANELVLKLHRHHKASPRHRFSIGCSLEGILIGAAIIGQPVGANRMSDKTAKYTIVEITRLVTDGTPNACSFLYGAAARAAKVLGYKRIQTFILESEPGTSLKAAGWTYDGVAGAPQENWNSRPGRTDASHRGLKQRWIKELC